MNKTYNLCVSCQVISAQQLPKLNKDKPKSIVDPFVKVDIFGVPTDRASSQTQYITDNGKRHQQRDLIPVAFMKVVSLPVWCFLFSGFNPSWNARFDFIVQVPELAIVRFQVDDYDAASQNDFIGQYTLPFTSMQNGKDSRIKAIY